MTDLLAAVLRSCQAQGDAPALTGPDGRPLSYRDLAARITATAQALTGGGMRTGDRVLFSVRPSPACVVLALGIVAAGGTVVFADPGAGAELFAARFALAAPRWAAAESLLYAASGRIARGLTRRRGLLLPDYAALAVKHIYAGRWLPGVPRGALSARRLAGGRDGRAVRPPLDTIEAPQREALVVFTSGTTEAPKAVVHTRGSLGASLAVLANACRLGPGDVVHTDQLMLGLPALVAGAHWTMPPYGFNPATDPARYATGLAGATHTFTTPVDLAAVVDLVGTGRLGVPQTLRHLLVGGAPVLAPLLTRARNALPHTEIRAVYGMTEILPVSVATAEEKLTHDGPGDPVGGPLPGVRARLGPDGELYLSGEHLCHGYLGEPPLTEHATGDLARLDDQGRIILVGRKKDMLIRGRTNIYPGLYEPTLARLPGVADVALIGVPDEIGDDRVVLVVAPAADSDGVPRVLPGHPLAERVREALPALIDAAALPDEVLVVSRLPVSGRTGKPDRAALRNLVRGNG
ncbi:class I adenylate-forming enzyme family protein [Dactylosporangium sp. NPDC051484]|uniref:class I adenylate-forming enzyme family protein n=1 Tax=Dactylosporangium sp. NPDC051484 TaxID=3154942 RepID=UPI00344B4C42